MTELLERAIARARRLPRQTQDVAAEKLLKCLDDLSSDGRLSIDDVRQAFDQGDFLTIAKWRQELGLID